jgi:hypothetical protein
MMLRKIQRAFKPHFRGKEMRVKSFGQHHTAKGTLRKSKPRADPT